MKELSLQRGNIMFALFAAIGLVGLAGAGSVSLMKGPVSGMSSATAMKTVNADLSSALTLLSRQGLGMSGADCDGDGKIEPMPYRDAGTSPKPIGGGYLPASLGTTKIDPWKSEYGYCAWDHGTAVKVAGCGGAGALRLRGGNTSAGVAIAVISAGPDRAFQTSCADWVNDATTAVTKPAGSDDVLSFLSYEAFTTPSGGDAKLEELADELCNPQNIGIMRRSMGVVQVCMDTGWEEVGTSAQADTTFAPVTGAQLNTTHTSNQITFSGFMNEKTVTVSGAATLLVNGVVTAAPAKIKSGDRVSLRANAAGAPETTLSFGISVGGIQRSWTIRTRDRYPAALSITPASVTNMHVRGPSSPAYGTATGFVVRNTGEIATVALSAAVLSNTTNFEFTGAGDNCVGRVLAPNATCAIDIRSRATSAHDLTTVSGSLSVVAGSISVTASPLSGIANGWTCTSPWGGPRINSGTSVTAYQNANAGTCNGACPSQSRACTADSLSGTYQYQSCNPLQNCTYSWSIGAWGTCSQSCGGGTQTRTVTCLRNDGTTVVDSDCITRIGAKPDTSQACNVQACEIVKTITATTTHVVMQNLFTPAEWSSSAPKRVVINSGVTVGSTSSGTPAIRTGTAWGGTLTLDNNGSIQGAGGTANSGVGGTALLANASGLTLRNYGTIYAGGGGGGRGGNGGGGYTTSQSYIGQYDPLGNPNGGWYINYPSGGGPGSAWTMWIPGIFPGGVAQQNATTMTTSNGAYTYVRGTLRYNNGTSEDGTYTQHGYIVHVYSNSISYTTSGTGGNGGRGRGYDGANASGAGGAAGGTNAGAGGTGGTGGGWGVAGGTGNTGAAGNNGAGAAGTGGGAAGFSIQNSGNVTISVTGTMAGRT